jgi:hypothetical protein
MKPTPSGTAGYQGAHNRANAPPDVTWPVTMRPGKHAANCWKREAQAERGCCAVERPARPEKRRTVATRTADECGNDPRTLTEVHCSDHPYSLLRRHTVILSASATNSVVMPACLDWVSATSVQRNHGVILVASPLERQLREY